MATLNINPDGDGVYHIRDESITDHSDASTVNSLAWAVAQINAQTTAASRRAKIKIYPGEYDFTNLVRIEDNITIEGSGPGATLLNFNSTSGGMVFSNGEMHTASEAVTVGEYRFPNDGTDWPHEVRFRCTTAGTTSTAASFATSCAANLTVGNTFTNGTADFETVAFITPDFEGFAFAMAAGMTGSGITVQRCNGARWRDLIASGGNASGWALEVDTVNQFSCESVLFEVDSNGILVNVSEFGVFPYNYGDGVFQGVDITLGSANTVGVKFLGSDTTNDTINNILFDRCEIAGTGAVADCNVGIWLEQAKRNTFLHLDVELCNVGIMEIGAGNERSQANTFIQYQFQPGAGDQTTEGFAYARGVPLQTAATTPFTTATIRENWLNYSPFDLWPAGSTTGYIADDDGAWGRDVTAVGTPSGGLVDLTMSGTIPSSGRTNLNRHPVIAPVNVHANGTRILEANGTGGVDLLGSSTITLGNDIDDNHFTVSLVRDGTSTLSIRDIRATADGLNIDVYDSNTNSSPTLSPEASADQVYINRFVAGDVLSAAPSTVVGDMIIRVDATGSTAIGGTGAGTYIRDAANTAWTKLN